MAALPKAKIVRLPGIVSAASLTSATSIDVPLDLRNFDFEKSILSIENSLKWESYPENLYAPNDFTAGTTDESGMTRPGEFSLVPYATYRLRLLLPAGRTYSISWNIDDDLTLLFINGQQADLKGPPGTASETSILRQVDTAYTFTVVDEEADILVRTNNSNDRGGERSPRLFLGSNENIQRKLQTDVFTTSFIMGCLFTAALFHFALYIVNRRRKIELIYSVCCMLTLLAMNRLIQLFFPGYDWQVASRITYLAHYAAFGTLMMLFEKLFPTLLHRRLMRYYYLFCAYFMLSTIVLGREVYFGLIGYFDVASFAVGFYVMIRLVIGTGRKKVQRLLALIGLLVLLLFGINDFFYNHNLPSFGPVWGMYFTAPIGMVFFVFCYALLLALDNTEAEQAALEAHLREENLTNQNAALDRLNLLKNELMATVSHETRTSLAVLSGYTELIAKDLRRKGVDDQTAKDLDRIADEVQRVAAIVAEMQNISKENTRVTAKVPIQLKEILAQSASMYAPLLARKNNVLIETLPETLPPVVGCASELTQVMFNLLQNADRHTENGSILLSANAGETCVAVTVADTGMGISPDLLPRVLERGVSGRAEGNGIGLAVCKEIIDTHGGTIEVRSEPGAGTAVTFTLPIEKRAGSTALTPVAEMTEG